MSSPAITWEAVAALEAAEAEAWTALFAAAPPPFASAVGLETQRFGPTVLTAAARIDDIQFNRLWALADDTTAVDHAVDRFKEIGVRNALVQIAPGPYAAICERRAVALGLGRFKRDWAKFRRDARPAEARAGAPPVELVTPENAQAFAETALAGFRMPPQLGGWLAALPGAPGWRCYLALEDGRPIGAGALHLQGDTGWLGIGATRPDARGRGAQSALLARRIADGASLGARTFVTETGVPLPGEAGPSYANIQRAGFEIAYLRPNWTF